MFVFAVVISFPFPALDLDALSLLRPALPVDTAQLFIEDRVVPCTFVRIPIVLETNPEVTVFICVRHVFFRVRTEEMTATRLAVRFRIRPRLFL